MVKDHTDIKKETRCRHMGYSFRLAARVSLYASSHRQDNTYHGLCYTSCGALAGTRNSSMGPTHEGSIWRPIAPWANALTMDLHLTPFYMHHPTDRIAHTTAFVTPVVELWLEPEIAQRVHHEESIWRPIAPWANALTMELHLTPFYMHHPTDRIAHTTAFVAPAVELWLEWEIAQRVHHEGSIWRPIAPWANALTTELHLAAISWRPVG